MSDWDRRTLTDEEKDFVAKNIDILPLCQIGKRLKRSMESVRAYVNEQRSVVLAEQRAERDAFIVANYRVMTADAIAEKFGICATTVRRRAVKLGAQKEFPWTDEGDKFIIDNYKTMSDKQIAKALGRNEKGVENRRLKLRILRTADA